MILKQLNRRCPVTMYIIHGIGGFGMNKPLVKRRRRRINGSIKHNRHLAELERNITSYPSPVYTVSRDGVEWRKRLYRSSHRGSRAAIYNKSCNRVVRRYRGNIPSGSYYKRMADFWWLLY